MQRHSLTQTTSLQFYSSTVIKLPVLDQTERRFILIVTRKKSPLLIQINKFCKLFAADHPHSGNHLQL